MSIRRALAELGVAGPLAAEIEKQITAGVGNARRLRELGFVPGDVLAAGIAAKVINVARLAELGTPTEVARYLGKQVNKPPSFTTIPTISGTAQVGQVLTASNGAWTGATPITYTYQWNANSQAITGATGSTYTPVAGNVGQTITVRVTAANAFGFGSATSNPTAAVIAV